jgi:hypothetical protein
MLLIAKPPIFTWAVLQLPLADKNRLPIHDIIRTRAVGEFGETMHVYVFLKEK